jgi:hypothetical protein
MVGRMIAAGAPTACFRTAPVSTHCLMQLSYAIVQCVGPDRCAGQSTSVVMLGKNAIPGLSVLKGANAEYARVP